MATSFPVRLGRQLRQLREKRGLSPTQLADMSEIGRAHFSQIENGVVAARIDTLMRLLGRLNRHLAICSSIFSSRQRAQESLS